MDAEYMCPNCVTPWKCNGPHIPEPPAVTERHCVGYGGFEGRGPDPACSGLAAPAVTETADLRAAREALRTLSDLYYEDAVTAGRARRALDTIEAALAAPAVTETADLRAADGLAALFGIILRKMTIDAFLASPQAAEELARARHNTSRSPHREHDLTDCPAAEVVDDYRKMAIEELTAWQKVRHPEDGS